MWVRMLQKYSDILQFCNSYVTLYYRNVTKSRVLLQKYYEQLSQRLQHSYVHIKRLREKLEGVDANWQLKTVWGVGYKFEVR